MNNSYGLNLRWVPSTEIIVTNNDNENPTNKLDDHFKKLQEIDKAI